MQAQPISPSAEATADQEGIHSGTEHAEDSPGKKSVMKKVKDKAKKLKTKIKKPKSPGSAGAGDAESSSEDESGSEPNQQVGDDTEQERDVVVTPGLQGDAFEAIPDPHTTTESGGAAGVEKQFGLMDLEDKPETAKLQEEVPSAPESDSVGATPNLASHDPVEEGKNVEGQDLPVTPTSADSQEPTVMDEDKAPEDSQTSDNTAESVAATAAAGAGAIGIKSLSDESESTDTGVSEGKKSMLEQAKEKVFGTSTKKGECREEQTQTTVTTPTITERATGLKDTIAAKLGYGSNKNLTAEGKSGVVADAHSDTTADAQDLQNKSVVQKITEGATGAGEAVTSKLGYGDKKDAHSQGEGGSEVGAGEKKTYTQKAYDAAYGAKDAVAAKLGYGSTNSTDTTAQGEQKSYLQGAKDAVTSKLGYANRELPASTEGAYSDEQNVPASTAARFHPGDEDRALSQLITEKMSTGAATVKDTLFRPFGASKSGPPTPVTTPPPSSAAAVAEDPVHNTVTGAPDGSEGAPQATGEEKPAGIVGKVTGAVTSLLGTSGSGKKKADETTGRANADSQATGVVESS